MLYLQGCNIISDTPSLSVPLFLQSRLSTNYNYICRDSVLLYNSDKCTSPTKTILIIMSPSVNKLSGSNDKINIYTEDTTIPTSPSQFFSKSLLGTTIQSIINQSEEQFSQTTRTLLQTK